jgi:MFS family permease
MHGNPNMPERPVLTEPDKPTSTSYRWWVVFMLWFVCFFNYADRQAIFSVFPLLERELGLSKLQLGMVGSAFMWIYAALAPLAGFIGDRTSRKNLILGGFSFWSIITVATGWATIFWHLVTFRALEGFGEAFYFPASMSLISDYHGQRTRSRAMSFHQSSVYIGTIGGGALGGLFGQLYGWRTGFYVFGLSGLVLSAILMRFLREPQRGQSELTACASDDPGRPFGVRAVLREVFRSPTAILLLAVFCGANFVAATFLTWTPSFLREKFQMNLALAGLTATIYIQLASAVGSPAGGYLAAASLLLAGIVLFVRRDVERLQKRTEKADVAQ